MIYNYIKCESVIAKIMTDLDSTEVRLRMTDIKEWIFEAVDKIGAPTQYITKESGVDDAPLLKIIDHQVPLPTGLQSLDGVAYSHTENGPWIPVKKSTSIFKLTKHHNKHKRDIHNHEELKKIHTSLSQFYQGLSADALPIQDILDKPEYFIKPGWIVINRPTGYIKLSYKTIATDERGFPLIPDLSSYQEAIYWYVVMKLSYPKLLKGQLGGKGVNTGGNLYTDMRQLWNFYRNQAFAEAMMPTPDDIENIKNDWHKLIPEWDSDETFFKDINKTQSIYTDYYYGY